MTYLCSQCHPSNCAALPCKIDIWIGKCINCNETTDVVECKVGVGPSSPRHERKRRRHLFDAEAKPDTQE